MEKGKIIPIESIDKYYPFSVMAPPHRSKLGISEPRLRRTIEMLHLKDNSIQVLCLRDEPKIKVSPSGRDS